MTPSDKCLVCGYVHGFAVTHTQGEELVVMRAERDRLAKRVKNADDLFMKINQLLDGWHSDIAWTEDDELLRNAISKWRQEKR